MPFRQSALGVLAGGVALALASFAFGGVPGERSKSDVGLSFDSFRAESDSQMSKFGLPHIPNRALAFARTICERADLVAIGKIASIRTTTTYLNTRKSVESLVVILVESTIHGESAEHIRLSAPIGWTRGKFTGLGAYPPIKVDERYLFVLRRAHDRELVIAGNGRGAIALDARAELPPQSVLRGLWNAHCRVADRRPALAPPEID